MVVGDRVFVGSADGRLYGLSVKTRREALAVRGRRRDRRLARRGRRPAGDRQRRRPAVLLRGEEARLAPAENESAPLRVIRNMYAATLMSLSRLRAEPSTIKWLTTVGCADDGPKAGWLGTL